MANETYLVTGAMGCIGSWVLRHLTDQGAHIVATDLQDDPVRARLLLSDAEIADITWERLDVTDTNAVSSVVENHQISHVVHLAGLQIPFCRANPPLGAAVNVTGTVNIFEAVRAHDVKGLAYASSLAALGAPETYDTWPLPDAVRTDPATLYGVYKVANEETGRIYAADWNVGSIGLRPYTVYGVARDQGVTADPAKAILAAAAGVPFHIRFSGQVALQHASDVARIFIGCANAEATDAHVFNLRGDVIEIADFVEMLKEVEPGAKITFENDSPLPYPADLSDAGLRGLLKHVPHTPVREAMQNDIAAYRDLLASGKLDLKQLEG
ncbi:MAG: NAD(P)-dependent oxidoreductase [Boseongicola sp.]|nr:NAD(P)-dependent oxidoreductase [Boseongicola sp.]